MGFRSPDHPMRYPPGGGAIHPHSSPFIAWGYPHVSPFFGADRVGTAEDQGPYRAARERAQSYNLVTGTRTNGPIAHRTVWFGPTNTIPALTACFQRSSSTSAWAGSSSIANY